MTAIALNYSTKLGKGFAHFFKGIWKQYCISRQLSANAQIARLLIHEYPSHTVQSLQAELNEKTLMEINKNA